MDDLIFSSDAPSTDWIAADPSDFGYMASEGSNMTVETYPQSQEPVGFTGGGDAVLTAGSSMPPPAKLPVGSFTEFMFQSTPVIADGRTASRLTQCQYYSIFELCANRYSLKQSSSFERTRI